MHHLIEQQMQQAQLSFAETNQFSKQWLQAVDKGDYYLVTLQLPGLKQSQVHINLMGQTLTISGTFDHHQMSANKNKHLQRYRQYMRQFSQSIMLPTPVDRAKMTSSRRQDTLTITLPKQQK